MSKYERALVVVAAGILAALTIVTCTGCTATTVRTSVMAAPSKTTGETLTTVNSKTQLKMDSDVSLLDNIGAFIVGLL